MPDYWTLKPSQGPRSLRLRNAEPIGLDRNKARIRIVANSINARDVMVAMGNSPMPVGEEIIPLSDGSGIVEEVGADVSRVVPGDRVVITFNPAHQSGPYEAHMAKDALGELRQGLLAREVVIEETALVKLPDNISFEQAACLPCVGVTAWNALFEADSLKPGQTVLCVGTGMVSLTALQLAKAAGARCGLTTSDNTKTDTLEELGADFVVNYHEHENWDKTVREATDGRGADVVLETAGPASIARSVKAAAQNGRVMQIGYKGMEGEPIDVLDMLVGGVKVMPIMVGSRAMLERLVDAVGLNQIEIPIHARFGFNAASDAFEAFMSGQSFGKTVISD